ncbi:DUF1761 domain-containing protein [Candidatus Saccharibacteria bacterium]|nr:DUF1761 domain-containing protein [Candidatus Saccharibacteria bacterium]
MEINIWAVIAATAAMFAVGAFWYMAAFGKMWGEMFGFDKLSKEKQKEMQNQMGPWYGVQLAMTLLSAFVLSSLTSQMPTVSLYKIVFSIWLGFIVPVTVSGVIFGGTETKWMKRKIFIQIGESLAHLLVAAWVIGLIQK